MRGKVLLAVLLGVALIAVGVGCTHTKLPEEEYAKKAMESYRNGRYEDAYSYYELLLKFYPESDKVPEYKRMLAETIYKLMENSPENLKEGYLNQLKSLGDVADTLIAWVKYQEALKNDQEDQTKQHLRQLGLKGIMLAAQYAIDRMKYKDAARAYEYAVELFPSDTAVYKAAFLAGYVYSEYLKNYDKAREFYQLVVEKFPNCELADDAQFMLDNMGKPPEEIQPVAQEKTQAKK